MQNNEIKEEKTVEESTKWFWEIFKEVCHCRGLTPTVAVRDMKLSTSAVTKWKNGAIPFDSTMRKIADFFQVNPDLITKTLHGLNSPDESIREWYRNNWRQTVQQVCNRTEEEYDRHRKAIEYIEKHSEFHGEAKETKRIIPVYGRVAAGIPIEEITDIEDYEEISDAMAANGEYFALKIHGDSMEPRMCEGDVIIVRKQENVESGETAVVSVNGFEATCKKVCFTDDGVELVSINAKYKPMVFTKEQAAGLPIKILGKVVEIRCKSW